MVVEVITNIHPKSTFKISAKAATPDSYSGPDKLVPVFPLISLTSLILLNFSGLSPYSRRTATPSSQEIVALWDEDEGRGQCSFSR